MRLKFKNIPNFLEDRAAPIVKKNYNLCSAFLLQQNENRA